MSASRRNRFGDHQAAVREPGEAVAALVREQRQRPQQPGAEPVARQLPSIREQLIAAGLLTPDAETDA